MKVVLVTVSALLALAACGSEDGSSLGTDPGSSSSSAPSSASSSADASPDTPVDPPPQEPVPAGQVSTRGLATVLQDAAMTAPELCLGPVSKSYPPQCSGPPVADWDWEKIGGGMHETQGDTRWGEYAVTGTWDGTTFAAASAIPAALYDPAMPVEKPTPTPATAYDQAELEQISTGIGEQLPDALSTSAYEGHVLLDVVYDDGSLQQWADDAYGAGVVLVSSALVDVEG